MTVPTSILRLAFIGLWPGLALAQDAAAPASPQPPVPDDPFRVRLSVGWEARRDRHTYRFENPSRYDTAFDVPHFYEQAYDADNQWLIAGLRYGNESRRWDTEVGLALWGTGQGRDEDTFFQPGDIVLTYGTTAETAMRSIRFAHHGTFGRPGRMRARVGYAFRRDRARFAPSDTVIRRTNPASEVRFFNDARETTISSVHDVLVGVTANAASSDSRRVALTLDVAPLTAARLTTQLPDKYPGRDIVDVARGFSMAPSLTIETRLGPVDVLLRANYSKTWSYRHDRRFTRDWFGVGVSFSPARR